MENVNIPKTCYKDYPESEKHFEDPKFPTHADYPLAYVRQITLGSIYGVTYSIDAAKMTEKMVHTLLHFLHECTTVVVGFNWKNDAWAFHLTFGERARSFREYDSAPSSTRAKFRADNMLKLLQVFDIENALRAATIGTTQHRIQKYDELAMVPEGDRDVSDLKAFIDQYPTENQEKHLVEEVQLLIDARNCLIDINTSDCGYCTASALDPGKLSKIAKAEYVSGTLPEVPSCTQNSTYPDQQPSTRPKNHLNEAYDPKMIDLGMSPGDWPMFLIANSPRSSVEARHYLTKVQKLYRSIQEQPESDEQVKKLKHLAAVHWLDEDGNPSEALFTMLKEFPQESPAKDCWNNFATSYVKFEERDILPADQSKNPDVSLTTKPEYDENPHFYISLHLTEDYCEDEQTTDSVDNVLTEGLSNLKVQEEQVEV